MQFIYILQLNEAFRVDANWTDHANDVIGLHFNYLKTLYESGIIKLVGKTELDISDPDNQGIVIFEASDTEAARKIMLNDPAVIHEIMKADIFPFRIVLPLK